MVVKIRTVVFSIVFLLCAAAVAAAQTPSLKGAYKGIFHIGAAINANIIDGTDAAGQAIVSREFDSISPENILKWEIVHPQPGKYDFTESDKYVAYGVAHQMKIIGHVLVWHEQTPKWVFEDANGKPLTREALLARMKEHIFTVVGRYKGRIAGWDVVNEALNEDGSLRQSPWMKIIGPDFIEKAFEYAHEADPAAELHYNEYSIENEAKLQGVLRLIEKLQSEGIHVNVVGVQGHYSMEYPTLDQFDRCLGEIGKLGVKVAITEFDINILPRATQEQTADISLHAKLRAELNPYTNGLPKAKQKELADRYAALFQILLKHRAVVDRVTFWGVGDGASWLNDWPVKGRTNYPLLFDRNYQPKPAYWAVLKAVSK
jgi:endo-1,4-beta-xylanase